MNGLCPPSGYAHKPVTIEELTEQLAKTRVELEQYKADAHYYFQKCSEHQEFSSALYKLRVQNYTFRNDLSEIIRHAKSTNTPVLALQLENLLAKATPHG